MRPRLLSLAESVVRLSRSIPAVCALLPPVLRTAGARIARSMLATSCSKSRPSSGREMAGKGIAATLCICGAVGSAKSAGYRVSRSPLNAMAISVAFSHGRTFPGQEYRESRSRASRVTRLFQGLFRRPVGAGEPYQHDIGVRGLQALDRLPRAQDIYTDTSNSAGPRRPWICGSVAGDAKQIYHVDI